VTLDHTRRLEDRVTALAGVTTGIFGVLATCGLILLPSEAFAQKVVIILASLGLSVALGAGIGAWRDAKRFAIASTAAMFSIVMLSLLAVVTHEPANQASAQNRAKGTNPSGSTTGENAGPGATESVAPANGAADDTSTSPQLVYLADLTPVRNSGFTPGGESANGTTYEHSLIARIGCAHDGASVEYNLNRQYSEFQATIGISDDAEAGVSIPFRLLIDGKVLLDTQVALGQSVPVKRSIAGAFRLSIEYPDTRECIENIGSVVWGDARLRRV
jgi:hypothetical protein